MKTVKDCISIIKKEPVSQRSKQIDVRYCFIRVLYRERVFDIKYYESCSMTADMFTKSLAKIKFKYASNIIIFKAAV